MSSQAEETYEDTDTGGASETTDMNGAVAALTNPAHSSKTTAALRAMHSDKEGKENVVKGDLAIRGTKASDQRSYDLIVSGAQIANVRLGGAFRDFFEFRTRDRSRLRALFGLDAQTLPEGGKVQKMEPKSKEAVDKTWSYIQSFIKRKLLETQVLFRCLRPAEMPAMVKAVITLHLIKVPPLHCLFHVLKRTNDGRTEWEPRWWRHFLLDKLIEYCLNNLVRTLKHRWDDLMIKSGNAQVVEELKRKKSFSTPSSSKRMRSTSLADSSSASTPHRQTRPVDESVFSGVPLQPATTPTPGNCNVSGNLSRSRTESYCSPATNESTLAINGGATSLDTRQSTTTQQWTPNATSTDFTLPTRRPLAPAEPPLTNLIAQDPVVPWFAPTAALRVGSDGPIGLQSQPYPNVPNTPFNVSGFNAFYYQGQQ